MQIRTILFLFVLSAVTVFAALNWSAFMAPTTLSLAVTTIQAPLGLVMLGFVAAITALFLAFVVYLQGTVILDARRQSRELEAQRALADKAESSRFSELRGLLETELAALRTQSAQSHDALLARLDKLDRDFGAALERTEAAMAAYVGELDNRLARGG
ncbi:MAG: LapA family protein [Betaproteobacteria bacterium]|nr:LapA family protein [Betaproteobacteria bacterium]